MPQDFFKTRLAQGRAVLAPMAGYTDAPFRKLCREFGSAWAVTEMVSAKALVLGNQRGIEIGEPYPGEPDLVIQIFGSNPELVAEAGRMLSDRYQPAALDLNMGCPVKKIINRGSGAQLMRKPELAASIIRSLSQAVALPISAKLRLGFDHINAQEVALALAEAGASALAIHGRTATQKYSGEANWEAIREIAEAVAVPVIGSGDAVSKTQFDLYQSWGLGVMVGRASLGKPWIFQELRGGSALAAKDIVLIGYRHSVMHCDWYGTKDLRAMRSQLLKYFQDISSADVPREQILKVNTPDDLAELILKYFAFDPRLELDASQQKLKAAQGLRM